eukprot:1816409-Alexandrium_andersonii.AAC.1
MPCHSGGAKPPTADHQITFSQPGGRSRRFQALFGEIKRSKAPRSAGKRRDVIEIACRTPLQACSALSIA